MLLIINAFLYDCISFFMLFKSFILFSKVLISFNLLFSVCVFAFNKFIVFFWSCGLNSFTIFAKLLMISLVEFSLPSPLLFKSSQKLFAIFAISSSCKSPSIGRSFITSFSISFLSPSLFNWLLIILPKYDLIFFIFLTKLDNLLAFSFCSSFLALLVINDNALSWASLSKFFNVFANSPILFSLFSFIIKFSNELFGSCSL